MSNTIDSNSIILTNHTSLIKMALQDVERTLLEASKVIEEQLDQEIERLDRLDDDELEKIRQKRINQVRIC